MTPDEIKNHPVFAKLTETKQKFIAALIENGGDRAKAAHAAWNCKSSDSARTMASRAMKDEHVQFLVESYFGTDPERVEFTRESALQFAAQKARKSEDEKVALDYFRIVIDMNGWRVKPAENNPGDTPSDPDATVTI